jgi:hypothetical protein
LARGLARAQRELRIGDEIFSAIARFKFFFVRNRKGGSRSAIDAIAIVATLSASAWSRTSSCV